jgi:hypothetical protein
VWAVHHAGCMQLGQIHMQPAAAAHGAAVAPPRESSLHQQALRRCPAAAAQHGGAQQRSSSSSSGSTEGGCSAWTCRACSVGMPSVCQLQPLSHKGGMPLCSAQPLPLAPPLHTHTHATQLGEGECVQ